MSSSVEEILGETTKFEKEYEWLQASELYEQALGMIDEEDYFRKGEIRAREAFSSKVPPIMSSERNLGRSSFIIHEKK